MHKETERVKTHLMKVFPDENPAELCQEWLLAIMTIRTCAEQRELCTWTMRPQPGEVAHFLGFAMRIFKTMIATKNAKRTTGEHIPTPPILKVIESRPEEEQIAFINSVVDALSDPEAEPDASPNAAPPHR